MEVRGNKKKKAAGSSPKGIYPHRWFLPLSIVIICLTTVSLYHKSVKNDFLDLDDTNIIVKNYSFLKNISNAGQAFKQGVFKIEGEKDTLPSYYRPITTLSYMVDASTLPEKSTYPIPAPFIKANIFYHTVACILLLLLLIELEIPPLPSLLLSLIFAVHPLLNQAVAWIPGRNDSLLTIFIIASFIFLLKYLKSKKIGVLIAHIFFFLLALFTKENAVMLVPIIFLYLRFVNKEKLAPKAYTILGVGYLICIVPWFWMRHIALSTNVDWLTFSDVIKTMLSNTPYFIQYISKSVLPFNLSVFTTASDTNYILGLAAIGLLLAGILLTKKKNLAFILFGLFWFLLFLFPSFFSNFSGLEHRAYLPLVGILFVVSQFDLIKAAGFRNKTTQSRLGMALLMAIFFLFLYISYKRIPIFNNRFSFDKSAVETSPHAQLPCLYLAAHYEQERIYDSAIIAYKEGLKRDSTNSTPYLNMGGDYIQLNNFAKAKKILTLLLRRQPKNTVAIFNLGLVVFQGDHNDSLGVVLWKKSIALDSGFAPSYKLLFQYYQAIGDSSNTILYRNFYIKKKGK